MARFKVLGVGEDFARSYVPQRATVYPSLSLFPSSKKAPALSVVILLSRVSVFQSYPSAALLDSKLNTPVISSECSRSSESISQPSLSTCASSWPAVVFSVDLDDGGLVVSSRTHRMVALLIYKAVTISIVRSFLLSIVTHADPDISMLQHFLTFQRSSAAASSSYLESSQVEAAGFGCKLGQLELNSSYLDGRIS